MIKSNPDVPVLEDEAAFYEAVQATDRPVAVLFWDGLDEDLMRSMPMGMRWLRNSSESRKYFHFYKILKESAPAVSKKYDPQGHEIIVFKEGEVLDRIPGFVYASEVNAKLMTYIDKKAPVVPS
jgi:hypothetical protein